MQQLDIPIFWRNVFKFLGVKHPLYLLCVCLTVFLKLFYCNYFKLYLLQFSCFSSELSWQSDWPSHNHASATSPCPSSQVNPAIKNVLIKIKFKSYKPLKTQRMLSFKLFRFIFVLWTKKFGKFYCQNVGKKQIELAVANFSPTKMTYSIKCTK